MGGRNFTCIGIGHDVNEAYKALCERAEYEYGHDPYNSTISTCGLVLTYDHLFKTFKDGNLKKAFAFIKRIPDEKKYIKGYVDAIDLGVYAWHVPIIKRESRPYTAKFKTKFTITDVMTKKTVCVKGKRDFETRTEAEKAAIEYAVANEADVIVTKEPVLLSGNDIVSFLSCEIQEVKKPTKSQKRTAAPMHKYLFFGCAFE